MKRVLAWGMLVGSLAGSGASLAGWIAKGEPQVVLQLSWFALIFSAVDAIFIEHDS